MAESSGRHRKFYVSNDLIDTWASILSVRAFRVYLVYCRHRNVKSGEACPSITTIREKIGMGRNQVVEAIQELVHYGLLSPAKSNNKKYKNYKINEIPPIIKAGDQYYHDTDGDERPVSPWYRCGDEMQDSVVSKTEQRIKNLRDTAKNDSADQYQGSTGGANRYQGSTGIRVVPIDRIIGIRVIPIKAMTSIRVVLEGIKDKEKNKTEEKNIPSESYSECNTAREADAEKTVSTFEAFEPEMPENQSNGALPGDPKPPDVFGAYFDTEVQKQVRRFLTRVDDMREKLLGVRTTYGQSQLRHVDSVVFEALKEPGLSALLKICDYLQATCAEDAKSRKPDKISYLRNAINPASICRHSNKKYKVEMEAWLGESKQNDDSIAWKESALKDIEAGYYRPELEAHLDRIGAMDRSLRLGEVNKFRTEKV